jgi:hypothetical protein
LPPVPSAVMVYVVATRGLTEMLPPEVGVVLPMPLLMLTEALPCPGWGVNQNWQGRRRRDTRAGIHQMVLRQRMTSAPLTPQPVVRAV